jgi:cGMP-dependent protein kinase
MGAKIVKNKPVIFKNQKQTTSSTDLLRRTSNISVKSKASSQGVLKRTDSGILVTSRFANKKSKINMNATKAVETNDLDVLKIKKKNNYEFVDFDIIDSCLLGHFFMRTLEKEARVENIKEMSLGEIEANQIVFKQGGIGNFFYIVKEGELDLFINDRFTKSFSKGESFGELALLHGAPRSGTVKSKTKCLLWFLERRNFRKIMDHINQLNFEENIKFINSIPILTNMENDLKAVLASNCIKTYYEAGKYIVRNGEMGNCLYIIKDGEVECSSGGDVIRELKKGDHFGEKALLLECPRSMDVIAKSNSIICEISVETLKSMFGNNYKDVLLLNFIKMAFNKSHNFSKISSKLLGPAYECFTSKDYKKGEIVVSSNHQLLSKIIVIIEGSIVDGKTRQIIGKRGDILFEDDIARGSIVKTKNEYIADPDCFIVEAMSDVFMKMTGGSFKDIINKSITLESVEQVPLFKNFTQKKKEELCTLIKIETFENGKKIIKQGETDFRFYIVKSGKVDISVNSNYIRTLNENEYFGERALFFNEPRTATAQANGKVELYVLEEKCFKEILEENLSKYLKGRFYLQDNSIELKDLDYIKDLGQGSFGAVSLVRYRKNKHLYAIKSMQKVQIDYDQLHPNIDLEKRVLLQIDHPFIVKLVKTLKDNKRIYFLMEYIRGKELFDAIRDIGLLNKQQTLFYGASMMLAIEYLHNRKIIYRDLKPENVLVTENGFIKLIDFGTVKQIKDRTATIIGTPHYMAPEVVLGEGYSFQVDYWSIAICIYEFICGGVPFGEGADDPMNVYVSVINEYL